MIIILITAACCLIGLTARSQTFSEWWHQKKTRMKYLHQQVAALEEAEHIIRDGYRIAEEGIHGLRNLAYQEFEMHENYFNGLEVVSPALKNCPEIQEYLRLRERIYDILKECMDECILSHQFTAQELRRMEKVFLTSLEQIDSATEVATQILTDQKLKMTDGERLTELRVLVDFLKESNRFLTITTRTIKTILNGRQKGTIDINELLNLN